MRREIKIKSESHAERCEICHQSDRFNPLINFCTRCGEIGSSAPLPYAQELNIENSFEAQQRDFQYTLSALGASISIIFSGVFIGSYIDRYFIQQHSVFFVFNSLIVSFFLLNVLVRRSWMRALPGAIILLIGFIIDLLINIAIYRLFK